MQIISGNLNNSDSAIVQGPFQTRVRDKYKEGFVWKHGLYFAGNGELLNGESRNIILLEISHMYVNKYNEGNI